LRQDEVAVATRQVYERVFKIPQPTNDVNLLFRMLQTHLENVRSKHPIVAVALSAEPIQPAREQFGLFETTLRNPQQLSETLARLTALLGADRVGTPVLKETHRPDAFRMEPFSWSSKEHPSSSPPRRGEKGSPLPEGEGRVRASRAPLQQVALRRFRPAVTASVLRDENKPAHVCSSGIEGKIVEQRGPYLLSGNWWNEKSWARAEWDMQLQGGELVRCHESDPPTPSYGVARGIWKVDGIYD
jgi:protein ImuB